MGEGTCSKNDSIPGGLERCMAMGGRRGRGSETGKERESYQGGGKRGSRC